MATRIRTRRTPASTVTPKLPSLATALEAFRVANERFKAATEQFHAKKEELRRLQRELKAATDAGNFAHVAVLAEQAEALAAMSRPEPAERDSAYQAVVDAARAEGLMTEIPEPVKVTRITVVDPSTQLQDSAVFLDSSDTVQLNVAGVHFESEPYHAPEWAREQGFVFFESEATVSI